MSRHLLRPALKQYMHEVFQWVPYWLFRDEFTTADPAPISSPRTAEPGPGTLTVVDTDNKSSISGGQLVLAPHSTPAFGDPGVWGGALARVLGRALLASVTPAATNTEGVIAFDKNKVGGTFNNSLVFRADGNIDVWSASLSAPDLVAYAAATYNVDIIVRHVGAYYLIRGDAFTDWTLLWADSDRVDATIHPTIATNTATLTADYLRVTDLPAPFNVDILHSRNAGNVAVGTTFTHPKRTVISFDLDTLTTTANMLIRFRLDSAADRWAIQFQPDGDFVLQERIDSNTVIRATASGVLADTQRIAIVLDGDNISGYYDGNHAWTWPQSLMLQSITDGDISALGSGAISDLHVDELGAAVVTADVSGDVANGTTFTHDADTRIEFDLDALPSPNNILIQFRIQDSSNYWELLLSAAGSLKLNEVVAGGSTTRATAGTVLSGGEAIKIEAIGSTITGWYGSTHAWSYTSATNFATATDGKTLNGTGGAISDLVVTSLRRHNPPGIATQSVLGPVTVGQVFVTEANAVWEFKLGALPAVGERISYIVRKQDATHNWRVEVDSDGDLDLIEDNAGDTTRINAVQGLSGGEVITVIMDDETITLYNDSTQAGSYASAANFKTETAGELLSIGTDGRTSDWIAWPRELSGAAKSALDRAAA